MKEKQIELVFYIAKPIRMAKRWALGGLCGFEFYISFIYSIATSNMPPPTSGDAEGTSNLYRDPVDFILFQ